MKKLALLALLFAWPLQAQDTITVSFPGGEYRLYGTVQLDTPPPTCPPGWTCTPPGIVDPEYPNEPAGFTPFAKE